MPDVRGFPRRHPPHASRRRAPVRIAAAVFVALAALATTGCAAKAARVSGAPARSAPAVTAPSSPPSAVAQVAAAECARFAVAARAITSGTQLDKTVGELVGSLNASGSAWQRALSRATKVPGAAGIPSGENRANRIAVDIGRASLDLATVNLFHALGRDGRVNALWTKTVRAIAWTRRACAS